MLDDPFRAVSLWLLRGLFKGSAIACEALSEAANIIHVDPIAAFFEITYAMMLRLSLVPR